MGYFSNIAIFADADYYNVSYTSPEQQLLWRLDDLYDRLSEIPLIKCRDFDGAIFSLDDYRYAPVKCFETYWDVQAAIQIAIDDLNNKYGIIVLDDTSTPLIEEPLVGQLTLFDNITQSCCRRLQQAA